MLFNGILSYPQGGCTTLGLLFSNIAALTATIYGVSSCRYATLTFRSNQGNFDDFVAHTSTSAASGGGATTSSNAVTFRVALGLARWLQPTLITDWTSGSCVGYTQHALEQMSDPWFNTSRIGGVLCILITLFLTIWTLSMSCFQLNRLQIHLYRTLALVGTIGSALTTLFLRSAICQSLFLSQECEMNAGGLVMIAGLLFWIATFVLSMQFLRPALDSLDELYPGLSRKQQEDMEQKAQEMANHGYASDEGSGSRGRSQQREQFATPSRGSGGASQRDDNHSETSWDSAPKSRTSSVSRSASARSGRSAPRTAPLPSQLRQQQQSRSPRSSWFASFRNRRTVSMPPSTTPRPRRGVITVDDVSRPDTMEMYLSSKNLGNRRDWRLADV